MEVSNLQEMNSIELKSKHYIEMGKSRQNDLSTMTFHLQNCVMFTHNKKQNRNKTDRLEITLMSSIWFCGIFTKLVSLSRMTYGEEKSSHALNSTKFSYVSCVLTVWTPNHDWTWQFKRSAFIHTIRMVCTFFSFIFYFGFWHTTHSPRSLCLCPYLCVLSRIKIRGMRMRISECVVCARCLKKENKIWCGVSTTTIRICVHCVWH